MAFDAPISDRNRHKEFLSIQTNRADKLECERSSAAAGRTESAKPKDSFFLEQCAQECHAVIFPPQRKMNEAAQAERVTREKQTATNG
jgi:hypothetical protein